MFGGVGGGGMGGYMMPAGGFWIQTVLDKTAFTQASQSMAMLGTEMKILGRDFMIAGGLIAAPMVLAAKEASRATVIQRAFNAVFREGTAEASRFVNQMARGTGRFTVDLQESLMSIQALFRGMNFGSQSAGLAQFTQGLMTDLAAFRGLSDQDVMQRFVSTLSGSVEAMDQLGIDVHEHAIQQELLAMGINKTVQEAAEQEKIMARLNVIHKAMGQQGAIGASTRAMGEFDGQIVQLNTSLKQLQQAVGNALKPVLEDLLPTAKGLVEAFTEWVDASPKWVQQTGEMAAIVATLGAAMWTTGAAIRVAAFGLTVFANPFMALLAAAGTGFALWATNAALASAETTKVADEVEKLFAITEPRGRAAASAIVLLTEKLNALETALAAAQEKVSGGPSPLDMLFFSSKESYMDYWEGEADRIGSDIEKINGHIQDNQDIINEGQKGLEAGQSVLGVGKVVEDEIAEGVHKGFLRGMEGTFSALSQRMFANRFATSMGETIAGGRSALDGGMPGRRSAGLSPRELEEARVQRIRQSIEDRENELRGQRKGVSGTRPVIPPIHGGGGASARQPFQFERDADGNPIVPDEYLPPIGRDYSAGLPEQYQVKPEGGGFMGGDYYSTEPGHPDGSTSNPLTNPATGEWRMRGKPGANRYGTFTPYNQGPNYNYDGNIPQGSTEAGTDPRGMLDEDRLEREFIPPQEPRYQEDTTLINEVREQVKNLRGLQDAILDLVTALSNPETFQQRYE